MASITFSGQLDQAMNELSAAGNRILFIPQQNVGDVLEGAASEMTVGSDGTYSITLAYNTYSIYHYSDVTKRKRLLADGIVVSAETSVTTIPGLIGSTVPVTEDSVLTIQGYLTEASEAKDDAEAAQSATEALFDDFDSSVAESVALVHAETPSLSIPFNESGKLDYGVGTEYVSGLPVYGVDFTRSTTSTVINKSGVLETLAADEMGIGADGVWLHEAYDNLLTYSDDLTNSSWLGFQSSVQTSTDTLSPDMQNYSFELSSTETSLAHTLYKRYTSGSYPVSDDSDVTFSMMLKHSDDNESEYVTLYISTRDGTYNSVSFYLGTGVLGSVSSGVNSYSMSKMVDGWYLCSLSCNVGSGTSAEEMGINARTSTTSAGVVQCYAYAPQLTESTNLLPYLPTTSSTTSATATSCTVPVYGNLPAAGESFTIVCDAAVPNAESAVFNVASENFVLWRFQEDGNINFRVSDGTTTEALTVSSSTNGNIQRYVITYDADSSILSGYSDGVLADSQDVSGIDWLLTPLNTGSDLSFGGPTLSYYLNSQIKNFKVLPYAASADEVASWGAPK